MCIMHEIHCNKGPCVVRDTRHVTEVCKSRQPSFNNYLIHDKTETNLLLANKRQLGFCIGQTK